MEYLLALKRSNRDRASSVQIVQSFSYRLVSRKKLSPPIHVLTTSSAPRLLSVEGVATIEVGRKQQSCQKRIWVFGSSRGCGFCLFRLMLWRFVDWTHVSWMRG